MENEKIKNKRLISWAYIWRFFILVLVFLISNMLVSKFISLKIEEKITAFNSNFGDLIINGANVSLVNMLVTLLLFSLVFIIGWKMIHKKVFRKFKIEQQNEKYILRSVNIVTGIVMLLIVSIIFLKDPIQNTLNLGPVREILYDEVNRQKDLQDLVDLGIMQIGESYEENIKSFNVISESVMNTLKKMLVFSWVIALIALIEVFYLFRSNNKKIKNTVIENSIDADGNIIPTQEKIKKKYKRIFIIYHVVILLVVIGFISYNHYQKHKYDWYYEMMNKNSHEKITDFKKYIEINLSEIKDIAIEELSGDELSDEENKYIKQLEHEREWYLNNFITQYEALIYKCAYVEHKVDKKYVESMYDELEKIINQLNGYLEKNQVKDLYTIEKEYNMNFLHIGMDEYVHIIDGKNLITGIGIKAHVDNFTDRNVLAFEMWDNDDVISEVRKEREKAKLKISLNSIEDKLPLIYADMKLEDVIEILGNSYIYEKRYNYASESYIWYDKKNDYIEFKFRDGSINSVNFFKN